ncbi:AAA family ATPase [Myxococcus faecalis]|uniref:AAA family ATPase n=1 Tax=Myxococcus faecalis TaxID=3115646 RepID=UPI0038D16A30
MRLDRLRIPSYRNLRSFEIDFDESQPTTVLLGRNGSGKSNLIEAIVEIFRELELGGTPAFAYTLDYVCRDRAIRIDADPDRANKRVDITVNGEPLSQTAFQKDRDAYLPNYVFAYYSGWSSRLERHFDRPTRKHYEAILKARDRQLPLRRMFFCRKEYSQLVLLAFFLAKSTPVRKLLARYLGIKSFESALFVLKTPWWRGSGAPKKIQLEEGDARFWYARGAFKGFLDRLWQRSLAPIRNSETVDRDVRRQGESTERLYLFIKNEDELAGLKDAGDDSKALFGYLESLFLCDLIDEVRVTVERTDGTRVKFTQMSEGEQQLLTVLGLLLFTQNDESLYLLDEPDTHLNPVWTYDFLNLLQDNIRAEKGQLIVATHNPLMIGSLRKNQVRILEAVRTDGKFQSDAREPDEDPFAMGVDGLLTSELYGLPSVLPKEVTDKIDERNLLFAKSQRSPEEDQRMSELSAELAELGVLRSYSDPYEQAFVQAMARRRQRERGSPGPTDVKTRNEEADAILEKLFSEGDGGT